MHSYVSTRSQATTRLVIGLGCLMAVGLVVLLGVAQAQPTVTQRTGPDGSTVTVTPAPGVPMPPGGGPPGPTPPGAGPSAPSAPGGGEAGEGKKEGEGGGKPDSDLPIAVFVPEKPNGDKLISMSFDQADIDHVLKFLAEQSGKIIVKEPTVQTKVTIVSTAKITVADAFRILSALLSVKGFAIIPDDEILRVVPRKAALQQQMDVTLDGDEIERTDDYVTHIVQIEHIDATKLKEDLKPLVPDEQGFLIANADTNTLAAFFAGITSTNRDSQRQAVQLAWDRILESK